MSSKCLMFKKCKYMKNLLIIGARGTGRGLYGLREDFIGYNETFVIKGFLDDDKHILDGFEGYPPILSSVEDYEIQEDDVFVCALGDPKMKQNTLALFKKRMVNLYRCCLNPLRLVKQIVN